MDVTAQGWPWQSKQAMGSKTVVIMQPTYCPWLGYFDLMDQCDVFVLLDSVQFDRRSWQQRNRLKSPQGPCWLTVPVFSKGKRDQAICAVAIDRSRAFPEAHVRTIQHLYAKAPYYATYREGLEAIMRKGHQLLADLNVDLVQWLRRTLGIRSELIRSSSLEVRGQKADLLLEICRALGAGRYLSPSGAQAYLTEHNPFVADGIELLYHGYVHPTYRQLHGPFIPHLSILDLLLNEGPQSLSIIRSGRLEEQPVGSRSPIEGN